MGEIKERVTNKKLIDWLFTMHVACSKITLCSGCRKKSQPGGLLNREHQLTRTGRSTAIALSKQKLEFFEKECPMDGSTPFVWDEHRVFNGFWSMKVGSWQNHTRPFGTLTKKVTTVALHHLVWYECTILVGACTVHCVLVKTAGLGRENPCP